MNKLLLATFISVSAISFAQCAADKQEKIVELFELTNNKASFNEAFEPMFANFRITDEKAKKTAIDKYLEIIKKDFVSAYDKFFNETDIDEMLNYHRSPIGKKFASLGFKINAELQKSYASLMQILQELMPKPEADSNLPKSTDVIHFDEISKDKTDEQVRNLFNQELKHDGLTVVKFSASWCGPCKNYVPEFDKVAKELKEVVVNGKNIAVKYIATDIEATKVIAQDYGVVSIPTTIIFKKGQKIDSQPGYMNQQTLSTKIKQLAVK